jgi:hypothetical protein
MIFDYGHLTSNQEREIYIAKYGRSPGKSAGYQTKDCQSDPLIRAG